jgi:hypothetical protein
LILQQFWTLTLRNLLFFFDIILLFKVVEPLTGCHVLQVPIIVLLILYLFRLISLRELLRFFHEV